MSADDLPSGWISGYSKTHGKTYFYHIASKSSQWVKPGNRQGTTSESLADQTPSVVQRAPSGQPQQGTSARSTNIQATSTQVSRATSLPAVANSGSFLGNLLGSMSKIPLTTAAMNHTDKADDKEDTEAQLELQRWEEFVARSVSDLLNDPSRSSQRFQPCEQSKRYIIHEVAGRHDLVSCSEGEDPDRCTVVYKPGFEPQQTSTEDMVDVYPAAQSQQTKRSRPRTDASHRPPPPLPVASDGGESLIVLNTRKRDLRSIEQIQQDMKNTKRQRLMQQDHDGSDIRGQGGQG